MSWKKTPYVVWIRKEVLGKRESSRKERKELAGRGKNLNLNIIM